MQRQLSRALLRGASRTPRALHARPHTWRGLATAVDGGAIRDTKELDQVTTLPNGLRVATEALPGPFAGVGVYVDAGSRYENEELRGVSHIIDRLAFKSTKSRTADQMLESLESLGGNIHCSSSRESLMYQSATFNSAVPDTLGLLAETIRDPIISEQEVQQQLETAEYEIGEIWSKPELILPEVLHSAAYKDNTLGNPLLCPRERLPYINKSVVEKYRQVFFRPERLVVAFVGVGHAEALRLVEKHFGDMKGQGIPETVGAAVDSSQWAQQSPSTSSQSYSAPQKDSKLLSKIPFIKNISTSAPLGATHADSYPHSASDPFSLSANPAHYTGGFLSLPTIPPPPNPALPRLSHIHLAFEGLPITSPDIYALATLQTLLGGGGSFSAGGPGKGMYSRLYTSVLNQHAWVESAQAFNHAYADSGLFGIAASCAPSHAPDMLAVMCRELHNLALDGGARAALQPGECQRAKNQLRSALLMNLESRAVELEDLGRQVQLQGRKVAAREMCERIEVLTVEDLRRVARQVVHGLVENRGQGSGAPTVVLQEGEEDGGTKRVAFGWDEIQERIAWWKLGRR